MISGLFDHDTTDLLVILWVVFSATGLILAFVCSIRAWRAQMAALLAVSAFWAVELARVLTRESYGGDCGESHHEGEWPMLILMLTWSVVPLVALVAAKPPFRRLTLRVSVSLINAALPVGTFAYIIHTRPPC
jgi:hypothetical protein